MMLRTHRTRIAPALTVGLVTTLVASAAAGQASSKRNPFHGWYDHSGPEPVQSVEHLHVSRDALRPGTNTIDFTLHSLRAQRLSITVVDDRGELVRRIVDAEVGAGELAYTWDGTTDTGGSVADGDYEVVVEANDGHESSSVSDTVLVDRTSPTINVPTTVVQVPSGVTSAHIPIVASEEALFDVTAGGIAARGVHTMQRPSGRTTVTVPLMPSMLRRAKLTGRLALPVRITATDGAGNRTTRSVVIRLKPVTKPSPSTGAYPQPAPTPVVGSSRMTWPLSGPLTSRFGRRWGRMHNGIDVGVPSGRAITAAAPGRVTYAGWMSGYGNTVIIDHGSIDTLYAHQSKILTRVGRSVQRGQRIGLVGSTGNSTGPHLHFEVRVGGAARDPLRYLP